LLVVVAGLMLGLGSLRARDIGLIPAHIAPAIAVTLAIWAISQIAVVVLISQQGATPTLSTALDNPTALAGKAIAQFFGNALYEEIVFRGFLISQVYLKLEGIGRTRAASWVRLGLTLLLSQLLFALIHIPIRIYQGTAFAELPGQVLNLFLWGLIFAGIYLISGNLFVVVGFHALANLPSVPYDGAGFYLLLSLMAVVLILYKLVQWLRRGRANTTAGIMQTNAES
jgi:membrane protease YdiL (CAAX protease family)